jgi:hypothetical protein
MLKFVIVPVSLNNDILLNKTKLFFWEPRRVCVFMSFNDDVLPKPVTPEAEVPLR